MKKQIFRIITIVLLAFSILTITQMAVYAQEENQKQTQEEKVSLLKTSDETYIIYVEDVLNTEFLFSFSETLDTPEEELIFSSSGLDSSNSNVAYMTKEMAQSLINGKTYIRVKANEKLTSYKIDLTKAVTSKDIEIVNTTTSRIAVDTTGSEAESQYVEGVKISHSQGKITILEEGTAFSYYIEKVADTKTRNFVELANQIINSSELSNFGRVALIRKFADTYKEMYGEINNWEEVDSNKKILQPQEETEKGDIYLVWLRNDETEENDVQILICDEKQDIEVEEAKKVIVYETTKLPVTYDSIITLITALGIVVAIILALLIIKKNAKNKKD